MPWSQALSLSPSRNFILCSFFIFFWSSISNLISFTWFILSSLRFLFFVFFFFFLCILMGEYSDIYYPKLLSLFPNFASCSSFLNPYLDPASSTLLVPLVYALFLLRLRSWSCYPRSFASFELREVPHRVFFCVSQYLLSTLRRSYSLYRSPFLYNPRCFYLPNLARYLLSHHIVLTTLLSFSHTQM